MTDIIVIQPSNLDPNDFTVDGAGIMHLVGGDAAGFVAGAVISGDTALMFQADGTVIPADPTAASYVYAGIALNAAQQGGSVTVQDTGTITASFWTWVFGLPIFTAPDGNLTQVPPTIGRSHIIGWAIGATSIKLVDTDVVTLGS